jgi:uncharacterized protein (DUF362 family)
MPLSATNARVSVRRWESFDEVDDILEQSLNDLGGIQRFVDPGQTVVIKPNLTANAPASSGGTTHVEVVAALVRLVQRCDPARIIVAEGTGRFGTELETAFPDGGWREMAAELDVELHNLDGGPHAEITLDDPRYPHAIPFAQLVLDADVFITVPCLKTHISSDYTVALKNSYALTPQWKRSEIHRQFLLEEALVDINRIRKPDLTVVDAWDGAEGIAGGTNFDRPAGARLLLTADDPVAVDVVSKEIMGITAPTRYLNWAIEEGVGIGDRERIEVLGDPLHECMRPFMSPADEVIEMMPGLQVFDQNACSGCRIPALGATRRFAYQKLLKPLAIVFGGEGELPDAEAVPVIIGKCAERYATSNDTHVPGCPPDVGQIIESLENSGAICLKCRELAQQALEDLDQVFLAHLRVTAAGAEVHMGEKVTRGEWHLELLVGQCMQRYARIVNERAAQFGLDAERDIVWLEDCPPSADAVREALATLQHNMAGVAGD